MRIGGTVGSATLWGAVDLMSRRGVVGEGKREVRVERVGGFWRLAVEVVVATVVEEGVVS